MKQEEKKELDPLGIYTEEELSILQYIRDMPDEVKDTMSKLTQGQEEIEIIANNCPYWNECSYPCKNCPTFKKMFKL